MTDTLTVRGWLTSSEQARDRAWFSNPIAMAHQLDPITPVATEQSLTTRIRVDPARRYQTMLGIGTSLEESTVYNLAKLTEPRRDDAIKFLLDPVDGVGLTLFRLAIGSPDFTAQSFYSYCDSAPLNAVDPLDDFTIQKDRHAHIIDTIHAVQRIAQEVGVDTDIRFFASMWSPPGWMKAPTPLSESFPSNKLLLKGGAFDDGHTQNLARYLVRFCEEYAREGIPIHALTMQNEPLLEVDYPSMLMSPVQQAAVAVELRAQLEASDLLRRLGIKPQLWAHDHNLDHAREFLQKFDDRSLTVVDGLAIHDYEGDLEVMTELKDSYPDKPIHLTERSVWGTEGADRIARYFRNSCSSYNAWVTMLDSNIGPHQFWTTPDTTLYVRRQFSSDEFWATPDLYLLGNFARFVRPGFIRIESDYGSPKTLTSVAFLDPSEQTVALILINQTGLDQQAEVDSEGRWFQVELPARTVGSFVWATNR